VPEEEEGKQGGGMPGGRGGMGEWARNGFSKSTVQSFNNKKGPAKNAGHFTLGMVQSFRRLEDETDQFGTQWTTTPEPGATENLPRLNSPLEVVVL